MSFDDIAPPAPEPPMFFHLVHAAQIKPGDVLYEINDRPLRGGAMALRCARHLAAGKHGRRDGWELVPTASRVSRFVDAAALLKVGRTAPARRVNPMVAAAAASVRKPKRRIRSQPTGPQMVLFDIPGVTK